MAAKPQHCEVGERLAVEDGFKVELQVGGAREGRVVAQQSQSSAVGDDAPEVRVGSVQELLHQPVRRGSRCATHTGAAPVNGRVPADQVYRDSAPPFVADRVRLAVGIWGEASDGFKTGEPQLSEHGHQPEFSAEIGSLAALVPDGCLRPREVRPPLVQPKPGAANSVPETLPGV